MKLPTWRQRNSFFDLEVSLLSSFDEFVTVYDDWLRAVLGSRKLCCLSLFFPTGVFNDERSKKTQAIKRVFSSI